MKVVIVKLTEEQFEDLCADDLDKVLPIVNHIRSGRPVSRMNQCAICTECYHGDTHMCFSEV